MNATVARLPNPQDGAASEAAPALGMSLQVDLGAGRVCTLQTFLPNDCDAVALNQMLDKMTAAGARQRAAYRIEELERELEKLEREQAQHKEDLDAIDRDFAAAQEARTKQLDAATKSLVDYETAAKTEWERSGRRGEFALKGSAKANFDRVQGGAGKLKGELANAAAERDKTHADSERTFERRNEIIAKARAELVRCQDTVAAGLKA